MILLNTKSIYYDDVNLIARPQHYISSRTQIPKQLDSIIISPMLSIVGEKFAIEALNLGLKVCLPRMTDKIQLNKIIFNIYDACGKDEIVSGDKDLFVSIGLKDKEFALKSNHKSFLIDVANGYLRDVVNLADELRLHGIRVMVGNIHSDKGLRQYSNCYVRVGIGQGTVCKTDEVTGFTRGQITEIQECHLEKTNQRIIADGGIKNSGCAVKAFGAGADYIMMGGYFKAAEESQNVIDGTYCYWGGASFTQQMELNGKITRHSEGKEDYFKKNEIRPLKILVDDLWGGISSGISYSGYANLTQFKGNGVFELKQR